MLVIAGTVLGSGVGLATLLAAYALVNCGKKRETVRTNSKKTPDSTRTASKSNSSKSHRKAASHHSSKSTSKKNAVKQPNGASSKSARTAISKKAKNSSKFSKSNRSGKTKSGKGKNKDKSTKIAVLDRSLDASEKKSGKVVMRIADTMEAGKSQKRSAEKMNSKEKILSRPVDVKLTPAELVYKAFGGMQTFTIINDSQDKRAFKVKCSDNLTYRVSPVYGMVEAGKSVSIDVMRQNGGVHMDKLVIITAKANSDANPKKVFERTANDKMIEMMVLPLVVQE